VEYSFIIGKTDISFAHIATALILVDQKIAGAGSGRSEHQADASLIRCLANGSVEMRTGRPRDRIGAVRNGRAHDRYKEALILGGIVIILLLLDPTRPLAPIFVLLALSVACVVVTGFLRG
jgi:hypothetical protein